ncbi:hypothetical protein K488DRAFT_40620, partial [Vararia minispora EC-137]
LQRCLRDAEERKQEGTEHFRASRWGESMAMYRSALSLLPKRRVEESKRGKGKGKARASSPDSGEDEDEAAEGAPEEDHRSHRSSSEEDDLGTPVKEPISLLEQDCAKMRAVLNANIGACYLKLGEHAEAVQACSDAIVDDPAYTKAILRRAQCNEKIGSWAALASAQDDYNKLMELLPSASKETRDVERALRQLKPRLEAAQKREVDEMMGKLKGLGNTILGKFGLSTDNFKFEPNDQGGYSMNFVR